MPKRTSGGPKAPVRALTSLLRGLDPTTKNTLNSAFADAETLLDFHSRSVPERQRRRRISGLVKKILLIGEGNLLGGFLRWERLDDPRISMYEAQISDDNIFSSPENLIALDTFIALENLRTIKYARVRGVQANGNAGLWSNVVKIAPRTAAPTVMSIDFYQRYFGAEPRLGKLLRYSGGNAHAHPEFYTVLSGDFYVDRLIGGLTGFGYICARLKDFADGGQSVWDRVRFKVDGITRMDGYFPMWTSVPTQRDFHEKDFHPTTRKSMTFYARGGYTASFGPYAVSIPNTLLGLGPNDPHSVAQRETADGVFYWFDLNNAARASRYDEAQLPGYNHTLPAHEAHADQLTEGGLTDWIIFRDFRFNVPPDTPIIGIEAKLKRRQPNIYNDEIGANFGVARPDRALGHDLVQERITTAGGPNLGPGNIFEDVDFGRAVDLTCGTTGTLAYNRGKLFNDLLGDPTDGVSSGVLGTTRIFTGPQVTFACWLRIPTPVSAYGAGSDDSLIAVLENLGTADGLGATGFQISVTANSTSNTITQYVFRLSRNAVQTLTVTPVPSGRSVNAWHHFACLWDQTEGPTGKMRIYVDGIDRGGSLSTNFTNNVTKNFFTGARSWAISIAGTPSLSQKSSIASLAHFGIWDKLLSAREIFELWEAKGRVDYRKNFGDYSSSAQLNHYFMTFPERTDIRDHQVCLVDQDGTIRTDLDNKALTTESWPQLSQFFYTNARQFGFLPLAVSNGVPHDNHTAIGYQNYGHEIDLWGAPAWTAEQVNSFYFGLAVRATNNISLGYRGDAFIDHAKLTVFTRPRFDRTVNMRVEVAASNKFYLEREIFGGIMNLIELGEKFAETEF